MNDTGFDESQLSISITLDCDNDVKVTLKYKDCEVSSDYLSSWDLKRALGEEV